ncbi:MAG: DUF1949 domain-containing protein [Candidatus Peribacteria bacterium]|nr:DUF1949 domain-containing protein [Candidatus Peribacteria bacterium]
MGGLIQAYTQVAQETVKHAALVQKEIYDELEVRFSYDQISLLAYLFEKYEVTILDQLYDVGVWKKFQINRGYAEAFKKELCDKSKGSVVAC